MRQSGEEVGQHRKYSFAAAPEFWLSPRKIYRSLQRQDEIWRRKTLISEQSIGSLVGVKAQEIDNPTWAKIQSLQIFIYIQCYWVKCPRWRCGTTRGPDTAVTELNPASQVYDHQISWWVRLHPSGTGAEICIYFRTQAPVPLSIFRSNSKFDENSECSSFEYTWPITTIFCTRHDSDTVVTCAKYRCDRPRIFYPRVFWIFIEFRIRSKYA